MFLFLDTNSNQFVTSLYDSTPVTKVNFTRGDVVPVDIGFIQCDSLVSLPSGTNITLGFKQNISGAFMAYANVFTENTGTECSPVYSTYLSLANTGIDSLFANGLPVYLIGQLSYGVSGLSQVTSNSLFATVQNDINTPSGSYPANSFVNFPATSIGISSYTFSGNNTFNVSGGAATEVNYINLLNTPSSTFTGNICLQAANGANQIVKANVAFPTSGNQVVNVFDTSPSGNFLYFFSGDGTADNYYFEATHTGMNWQLLNVSYIPAPNTRYRVCS